MRWVTAAEMRAIEAAAEAGGVSTATLMDRAGAALAEAIRATYPRALERVLVLVGPGNNGGDGLVAARELHAAGAGVTVYVWRHAADDRVYREAVEAGVDVTRADDDAGWKALEAEVGRATVIVDALLGTGVSRPIGGDLAEVLDRVRAGRRPEVRVVAVDLPSGVNADTGAVDPRTVQADLTVTFGFPKVGLSQFPAAGILGELVTANIGLADHLAREVRVSGIEAAWVRETLPARPADAHKGTFGKAMIVAGSINYIGAAYLCGTAAARVGAGLVTMGVPQPLLPMLAPRIVEATWLALPHDMGALVADSLKLIREKVEGYKGLLVGPGLGREERTAEFVHRLLTQRGAAGRRGRRVGFSFAPEEETPVAEAELPTVVVDADALNALAQMEEWWTAKRTAMILTPHPGEMGRLLGREVDEVEKDRVATAREAAEKFGAVVVLKGAKTVVASAEGEVRISPFANPALATAGTGDVLAGAITGFLVQGLAPFDAAAVGVYVHGLAGERVREELGDAGTLASDLLPHLPQAMRAIRQGQGEPAG